MVVIESVVKETKHTKLGIVFRREHRTLPLQIGDFRENSLLEGTALRKGMKILRINGEYVTHRKSSHVSAMVRNAEAGTITIEADGIVAKAVKQNKDDKLGIGLKAIPEPPCVVIEGFSPNSLFSESGLKPGQRLCMINDQEVTDSSREAIDLLKDAVGNVELVAIDLDFEDYDPEKAFEVSIEKPSENAKLGLTYRRMSDKTGIRITAISRRSLAANTDLKIGQRIICINGKKPKTGREATKFFKEAGRDVVIKVCTGSY